MLILLLGAWAGGLRAATLEELIANPQQWPTEVTLTAAARATVLKEGQPAGMMLLGSGRTLSVTGIAADGVTGRAGGTLVKVPVEKTDLWQRVGRTPPATAERAPATPPAAAAAAADGKTALDRSAKTPDGRAIAPAMQRLLEGKLVRFDGARLQPQATAALNGVKYYALYYSASWCGPCRDFTPKLVRAYRELKAQHPEFELVFVSADRSAAAMADYMKEDAMPWPAVAYDKRDNKIISYSGPGIPCLVLVDAQGRVLADSYRGDDYVGPQSVLEATRRLLKSGG